MSAVRSLALAACAAATGALVALRSNRQDREVQVSVTINDMWDDVHRRAGERRRPGEARERLARAAASRIWDGAYAELAASEGRTFDGCVQPLPEDVPEEELR